MPRCALDANTYTGKLKGFCFLVRYIRTESSQFSRWRVLLLLCGCRMSLTYQVVLAGPTIILATDGYCTYFVLGASITALVRVRFHLTLALITMGIPPESGWSSLGDLPLVLILSQFVTQICCIHDICTARRPGVSCHMHCVTAPAKHIAEWLKPSELGNTGKVLPALQNRI